MNTHPDIEHMIFHREHAEDLKRNARYRLAQSLSPTLNRRFCCAMCRLGHRMVGWGRYLEEHFALPEDTAPEEMLRPRLL